MIVTHKHHTGEVKWSEEDNVFYAKLLGTSDLVLCEGRDMQELQAAFTEAVESYEHVTNPMYMFVFDNVNMESDIVDEKTGKVLVYKGIAVNARTEDEARTLTFRSQKLDPDGKLSADWQYVNKYRLNSYWV